MQAVAEASQRAFAQRFIGRELIVLWESNDEGRTTVWSGYSDNYIRVVATSARNLHNRLTRALVVAVTDEGAQATV